MSKQEIQNDPNEPKDFLSKVVEFQILTVIDCIIDSGESPP